eukprot:1157879-Pelagomonas_calceolata.AAC.8
MFRMMGHWQPDSMWRALSTGWHVMAIREGTCKASGSFKSNRVFLVGQGACAVLEAFLKAVRFIWVER